MAQSNTFRFGNGAVEHTDVLARIPVGIGKKTGLIEAAVIKGQAPLLLGRPTLQKLAMHLDFKAGVLSALDGQVQVPMQCNPAGQVLLNVMDFPVSPYQQVPSGEAGKTRQHRVALKILIERRSHSKRKSADVCLLS